MHGFTILMSSILSKFGMTHVAASKGRHCAIVHAEDVKIRGLTERGRHLKRRWDFNYSSLLYNIL